MSSPIPYEFDDHDIVSPGYSVALVARYPLARLGRQFAPVDADDCAPGLESTYDAMVAAADREAPCPKCGSPGGPFTGFGLAGGGFGLYAGCSDCGAFEKHQTTDEPPDDVDHDRYEWPPLDISPALAASRSASLAGYIFGRGCDLNDCAAGLVPGPSLGDSP